MISALLACAACSDSGDDFADSVAPENKVNPGQMVIRLGRTLSRAYDLAANTRLFQFHADSVSLGNGAFVEEPALTPLGDDRLTFNLGEGVWNFSLVSSREPLEDGTIQAPEYGKRAQDCPMFSMTSEGGTLQSAPEIYTALVDNFRFSGKWQVTDPDHNIDEFVPDRDYTVDAQMLRNMAKIVVHFKSSEDLDPSKQQLFTITNVPTTLDWRGGLYPDKNNPEISAQPLRGAFDVHYETTPEANKTVSDQVFEYIIPAHRGLDYSASAPVDTTTSLLRLNVDFTCLDETHVVKNNIVLGYAPRVNGVYDIYVSYNKRKLNVEAQILPWAEERADADVSNAEIVTDKPKVEFAYRDTIRIESRRPVTVTKAGDASWLTVKKISDTMYALEADITTYEVGHPRSSYIVMRDGNLERRIPVTQRPDVGTIEVHVSGTTATREMWLSPVTKEGIVVDGVTKLKASDGKDHNKKNVDVTSVGGPWKILPNLRVYDTPTGGAGKTENVTLTRFKDEDIDFSDYNKAFGRERVIFMNTQTLDTASIWVDNLFIGLTDDIVEVNQPEQTGSTVIETPTTVDFIAVYGGDADINVKEWPDFVNPAHSSYNKATRKFTFASLSNKEGDDRYDKMVIAHKTDPDYVVEMWIDQAISVNTEPFTYFVVKFSWDTSKGDVDIQVGFTESEKSKTSTEYHGQTFNTSAYGNMIGYNVGWNHYASTLTIDKAGTCLAWGGDATSGQGETVYFNAQKMSDVTRFPYPGQRKVATNATNLLPRYITFDCAASWYSTVATGYPITCTIYLYDGGTMWKGTNTTATAPNTKNFYNKGGRLTNRTDANRLRNYTSTVTVSSNKQYRKFCRVVYDRKTYRAKIEWFDTPTYVSKQSQKSGGYGSNTYYAGEGNISSMDGVVQ